MSELKECQAPQEMTGWGVYVHNDIAHAIPLNDLRDHDYINCWCNPVVEEGVWHNAMDGREAFERGERKAT